VTAIHLIRRDARVSVHRSEVRHLAKRPAATAWSWTHTAASGRRRRVPGMERASVPRRTLIVSADIGEGHNSVGRAPEEAIGW